MLVIISLLSPPALCIYKYDVVPQLANAKNPAAYDRKWEKYGAYYDKDEIILSSYYSMQSATSKVEIFKRIIILSTDGAEYGTIPVWRAGQMVSYFEPRLFDAKGNDIKLDVKKMRKTYIQTDKVVFPNVTKGSIIELRMEFYLKNTYFYGYSEWFSYDIPIRVGRFIHNTSSNCEYDYKTYGNRYSFKANVFKNGLIKTWTIQEYEPRPDLDYLDYKANSEPKILVKLKEVKSWNKKYNTAKKIYSKYKNEIFGISVNFKGASFQKTLKNCISKSKDPELRARNILKWVQDNMVSTGKEHDYFGEITKSEKASDLQIACLCNTMFKKAGLKSNIVITGHKNKYMIDTTFLVKRDYITVPMPLVKIENKYIVAYPYRRGYELGEYPMMYNDVLCMNIKEKQIHPLPKARWGTVWISKRKVLNLSQSPGKYKIIYEFKENSASSYREDFLDLDKSGLEEKFENWIKCYKKSNILKTFEIKNMNDYDLPLQVIVHFENDDTPIPYGNKQIFQLKNFFYDYFEDITSDRTEDVFIHNPATYIDEIEILKIPGKKIVFDIKMEKPNVGEKVEVEYHSPKGDTYQEKNITNYSVKLFSVDYKKNETDSSYIFKRFLKVNPIHIKKEAMQKTYNDCAKLNSIKNSNITIE